MVVRAEFVTEAMSSSNPKKIYDAIDARNYKVALKLCGKSAARNPVVAALKALILQRIGRLEESEAECMELLRGGQSSAALVDENVLHPLTMTLNALNRPVDAMGCWEHAFATNPTNESFGRELFHSCLRNRQFADLRGIASKLFKATSQPDYLWWFASSALIESRCATNEDHASSLRLADRFAARALQSSRGTVDKATSEELELLLSIREEAGDLDACLSDLECVVAAGSSSSSGMSNHEAAIRQARVFETKADWASAREKYERIVVAQPNDWAAAAAYVRASHECKRDDDAKRVFDELLVKNPRERGPALAKMEILRLSAASSEELRLSVVKYAETWAHSRSCFDDLEASLRHLRTKFDDRQVIQDFVRAARETRFGSVVVVEDATEDRDGVLEAGPSKGGDERERRRRLQRHATFALCARFVGADFDESDVVAEFNECSRAAESGEEECADDLMLLCYRMLSDLARRQASGSRRQLALRIQAACLIEWARRRGRDTEVQVALASVESMEAVGGHEVALRRYGELGVKQIQLESLGWFLFPWASRGGFMKETRQHCHNIAGIHKSARVDASTYAARALENGKYARAVELIEFHELKMDRSIQLAIAKAELVGTDVLLELHTLQQAKAYFQALDARGLDRPDMGKSRCLNCDFRVFPAWRDAESFTTERRTQHLSCLRGYLSVMIAQRDAAAALVNGSSDGIRDAIATLETAKLLQPNEDDDLLRVISVSSSEVETIPWLAHPWSTQIWTVTFSAYRAAQCNLRNPQDDDSNVSMLRTSLSKLSELLLSPEERRFLRASCDDDAATVVEASSEREVAVSRQWLTGICYFLQHACAHLVLALQVLLPAPSRKKKKKGAGSTPPSEFASIAADLVDLLAKLRTILRSEIVAVEEENAVKERSDDETFIPAFPLRLFEEDTETELREFLRLALTSSQALSLDRVLRIVSDKHAALREYV